MMWFHKILVIITTSILLLISGLGCSGNSALVQSIEPTSSPQPTATNTPPVPPIDIFNELNFESIQLAGQGSAIVEVAKPAGRPGALSVVGNEAQQDFSILALNGGNNVIAALVETNQAYQGTVPIDLQGTFTQRLRITATGPWQIAIRPLIEAPILRPSQTLSGNGDAILRVEDPLEAAFIQGNPGKNLFVIVGYGYRNSLLVNTTEVFSDKVSIPTDTVLMVIQAKGSWSISLD